MCLHVHTHTCIHSYMRPLCTGIDLLKILGETKILGKPKYWGKRAVITDKSISISQLLRARARAPPKSTPLPLCIPASIHSRIHNLSIYTSLLRNMHILMYTCHMLPMYMLSHGA